MKVIKSYHLLTQTLKSESELSFDSDRAIAEYLAFAEVGELHAGRVDNQLALDVMMEVVQRINTSLQNRRKALSLL